MPLRWYVPRQHSAGTGALALTKEEMLRVDVRPRFMLLHMIASPKNQACLSGLASHETGLGLERPSALQNDILIHPAPNLQHFRRKKLMRVKTPAPSCQEGHWLLRTRH